MAEGLSLNATVRTQKGKGASRRMRRLENSIPAVVYGGRGEPLMLSLSGNELVKVSKEETFYSQILDLNIDGKPEKAVVRDIQRDPASGRFQHLDFLRIVADQAITVSVPLHFLNVLLYIFHTQNLNAIYQSSPCFLTSNQYTC